MQHYVWARVVWASMDLVANAGLPVDALFEGLPYDAKAVRKMGRVSWDDYCHIVERIEVLAGGPDGCSRLMSSGYHHVIPEVRYVAGALLSPKQLMRFIEPMMRVLTPPCRFKMVDAGEDAMRIDASIVEGARPCRAYFEGSRGGYMGMPAHLGLPLAEVEAEIGDREATFFVRLPRSRALVDRVRRRLRPAVSWMVMGFEEGSEVSIGFAYTPGERNAADGGADTPMLTDKQRAVMNLLALGKSNKEIASSLRCAENTVEYHVTGLLRRYAVRSRAELLAKVLAASGRGPMGEPESARPPPRTDER